DIREHDTTVEDIREHDTAVEDIREHDTTVEDIREHDITVEDIGENDTAVEDIGEHDTTVEDIGEHDTAVEDIREHDTTVEDIGEHDITVEDIGEHDKTVEDIEKQDKTVEDTGEQDKSREMVFVEEEDEEKSRDTVFVEEEKETTVEETVKDIWEQDKSPEMVFSEVEKEITVGETVEESRDIFEEATVRETVEEQLKSREIVFVEETEVTVKETVEYTEEQEESDDISHTIDTEESVVRPSNIIEEVAFSTDKESSDNVKIESHFDDSSRDAVIAEQLESESLEPFVSENLQAEDSLKNTETDSYNEKTMLHDDYTGGFNIAENASHDKKILNDETVESLNITYTTSEQNINVITRNVSESLETFQTEKDSETKADECLGNTEAETEIMQTEYSLKEDETENQAIPTEEPLENVKAEVEIIRTEEPLEDIKTETEKSLNVEVETEIIQTKVSSEIETEIEIRGDEVETLQTQESMEHVENKVEREFLEENKNETGMMKNESLEFENNEIEFINNSELENLQTQNSLEFDDWAVDSYDPSENVGTVNLQTQEYQKSAEIETLQDNDSQTNEEIVDSSSLSTEEIEVTPETIVKETIDQVSQNEETLSHEHSHLDTNKSVNYIIADEEKVEFIETVSPSQHYSTGSEEIISEDENQGVYKSQVEISDVEDAENNGGLISSRVTYESEGLVTEEAIEDDERTIVEEMVNEAFTTNGDTGPIEDYGVLRSNSYIPKPNEFYPLDKMTAGYDLPENLFEDLGSSATACGDSLSVKSTFPNTNTTIVYNTTIDLLNTEKVNLDKTVVSSILKDEKNEETVHINSTDVSAARRRSNTVSSSPGESTKNANSKSTTRNISQELVIKPKTKVFDKHSETLSQEIVTVNKSRSLELRRDEVKAEGDYKGEQEQELEVLKSIYPDELEEILDGEFRIISEPEEQDNSAPLTLALHIKYTPTYPDEIPEISVEVIDGEMEESEHEKIHSELIRVAQESIGMVVVFTLATLLKESLTTLVIDRKEKRKFDEEERIKKEIEAEQVKFQGTKVTVASFLEWKEQFDKEIEEKERLAKSIASLKKEEAKKNKLTGRQLFERDETLATSDGKYMEEEDVTVDVSLFEREDDMDLDDDSDEEENSVLELVRSSAD
ncbi:15563_t:CDS:2, partial [Acaulospora morrowiae]